MKHKTILVTGGSGFIGRNIIPALLEKKYRVSVIMRGGERPWGRKVTYHRADLRKGLREDLLKNVDAIVHLAGTVDIDASIKNPEERLDGNFAINLSVLEAARKSDKKPLIIFASTDRVYGKTSRRIVTESEEASPIEPYTATKIMGETMLRLYAALYDIPYIALRLDSVYGPGQPRTMFISDVIQKMLQENEITVGPLSTSKNFLFIDDAVSAILSALRAPRYAYNEIYNVGGSHASFKKVVAMITAIAKRKTGKRVLVREKKIPTRPNKAEVNAFILSTGKARRLLKWRVRTPLYKGLERTIEYFFHG